MKKGFATILLLFYFAFSSGVVINLHYCMNRFDSSKFGTAKADICGKCGMHTDDSNGCCHDEVKVIKIQDDQKTAVVNFTFNTPPTFIEHNTLFVLNTLRAGETQLALINHSPPISKQDTYLQNCVFRI
jgi:hypothetical protein